MGTTRNNDQADGGEIRNPWYSDSIFLRFGRSWAVISHMLIAYITERLLNEKEKQYIYDSASR